MAKDKLRLIPLGGLGEIGANCFGLEWNGELVLIDCGILFPDVSYPGVELFAPDLDYVLGRRENLKGLVLTHGHEDHIGAVPFLLEDAPLDIYCSAFPQGLIEQKFDEFDRLQKATFHRFVPHEPFEVGPFRFTPMPAQHSIIEAFSLAIETPVGVIVHSGDFKHDPKEYRGKTIDFEPLKAWGKKGVRLLLSDSTNAERHGHTLTEADITPSFERLFAQQSSRIFIALFASNVRRVENLLRVAKKMGKKVVMMGRSVHNYTRLAHEQSLLDIPEHTLILPEDMEGYPNNELVVLATGSQAEPRSALVQMAKGFHRVIQIREGDLVVLSSRFIPGNERNINSMINNLYRMGAQVLYQSLEPIHTSGHGFQDELKMMLRACQPEYFIPVHGEFRHLVSHARLGGECHVDPRNIFVIENGQVMEMDGSGIQKAEKLELQKAPIVNNVLLEERDTTFPERLAMAKAGIVFLTVMRDAKTLELVGDPQIASYGLLFRKGEDPPQVLAGAVSLLAEEYDIHVNRPNIQEVLRIELRRYLKKRVSHKPIVIPRIVDI